MAACPFVAIPSTVYLAYASNEVYRTPPPPALASQAQSTRKPMNTLQILMGVYHGAAHLPAQLQSIADQTWSGWRLLASDDSTAPDSRAALGAFAAGVAQPVEICDGPQAGFAANYLHLIRRAAPGPLAFADQDDLWLPEKLARAMATLDALPAGTPALYCARVWPWDGSARQRDTPRLRPAPMPPLRRPPGFRNALIENVAVGNTIVLNAAAAALVREIAAAVPSVFAHDWWLYLLITGVGGTVCFDDGPPVLLYRQHDHNSIGTGRGPGAQWRRKRAVLQGAFAQRLALNSAALTPARRWLTPQNAALLDAFETARQQSGPTRITSLLRLGLYRQHPVSTASFFAGASLGLV